MVMVEYAKRTPSPAYTNPALTNGAGTGKWTAGDIFTNVQSCLNTCLYWSSTTYASGTFMAWSLYMWNGYFSLNDKVNDFYVWPVRGGQSGSFGTLRIE
jgi:hypothetical protein